MVKKEKKESSRIGGGKSAKRRYNRKAQADDKFGYDGKVMFKKEKRAEEGKDAQTGVEGREGGCEEDREKGERG